jgi:hypothetical protein
VENLVFAEGLLGIYWLIPWSECSAMLDLLMC